MKGKEFYNKIYSNSVNYGLHYSESIYFPIYQQVLEMIDRENVIVELGCGTGQFAHYLEDNNIMHYIGLDFSDVAIEKAKSKSNQCFLCLDISKDKIKYKHDTIIALEVFEHLYYMNVLGNLEKGKRVIFSLPNFKTTGHLYAWANENEIVKDFDKYVDIEAIYKAMQIRDKQWFLVNGIIK